ncbi:MAG TPA: hypothetical protein VH247_09125 [Thermoleophilaceae bacterium]|jgi:hypothetical protein|nr:hypothetical protein [Thermoleophilaceae bacterium]
MASEREWHDKLRSVLDERIKRQDVQVGLKVTADPSFPIEAFDAQEFADWAADWVDYTVASTAGPVMPGTSETEWVTGDNDDVRVSLLLAKA